MVLLVGGRPVGVGIDEVTGGYAVLRPGGSRCARKLDDYLSVPITPVGGRVYML
jgi:hypothetical protein